jgi:DNA-binding CsgD family transcriptional regulator
MEKADLECYLAEGLSLVQIGRRVGLEKSTVSYHLKKHGLKSVNQGRAANRGGLSEATLREMVREGLTLIQMARRLDRSVSTVRCHAKVEWGTEELPEELVARCRPARTDGNLEAA